MSEGARSNIGLAPFLNPRSIAVIGATERPGSWGSFIMEGLLTWKYPGAIYPVNRRAKTVYNVPAFPDVESIPEDVELAVITIPEDSVEEAIRACGAKGVRGVIMITAGFGEAVEGGREREEEMARLARSRGMRILGPNVSGAFNLHTRFNASASPARFLIPTPVAAICQGGYAFYELLSSSYARGMGVGHFVHTGNECDLQVTDFLEELGRDPEVRVILMYLETVRDSRRFMEVVREVAAHKPVVVHKAGRTVGGARAAKSHTGAMAGVRELYEGAFNQANIVMCPSMELLLPLSHAFLEHPPMRGDRVAIVTMGGSWGVALTDSLEEEGLRVPELSPALQGRLRGLGMPLRASTRNPVDVGAANFLDLGLESVVQMGREVLTSGEVDALILFGFSRPGMLTEETPQRWRLFMEVEKKVLRDYHRLQVEVDRPVIIGSPLTVFQSQVVHDLREEGIRVHHRLDEIAQILSRMWGYWRRGRG